MWINLSDDEIAAISFAEKMVGSAPKGLAPLIERIAKQKAERDDYQAYREAVDTNDKLEVDADAIVSPGDDPGAWVHAWIWVTNEQAGIESEDEEEDATAQAASG